MAILIILHLDGFRIVGTWTLDNFLLMLINLIVLLTFFHFEMAEEDDFATVFSSMIMLPTAGERPRMIQFPSAMSSSI